MKLGRRYVQLMELLCLVVFLTEALKVKYWLANGLGARMFHSLGTTFW